MLFNQKKMSDDEQSTSTGPAPKRRRSTKQKKVYTEAEIQQLLEDFQESDDDVELIDDLDESDFSEAEDEKVAPEQPLTSISLKTEIPSDLEEDEKVAPEQPLTFTSFKTEIPSDLEEDVHFAIGVEGSKNPSLPGPSHTTPTNKWFSNSPTVPKIEFTGTTCMKVLPHEQTPFGYFKLFFTDDFFSYLLNEINDYAILVLFESEESRARISNWRDVTIDELKTFMGVLLLMGLIRVNRMNDYWKKHYLFNLSFPQFMARDRFLLILCCLRFLKERTGNDPILKIRPLMDYFNNKMKEICNPSRELSIDENMVLWRGKLIWRQYVQDKRHKFGLKLYVLSQPNGLVHKIHVYGGSKGQDASGTRHAAKIVRELTEGLEGEGHAIFMDNFYNSVPLTEELLERKIYCTGTLQSKRKGNPQEVVTKNVAKGESFCMYTEEGVCCCKWKDKREVLSISSEFGGNLVTTINKRGQRKEKPQLIAEYNKNTKGVDRQGQMLAYYPVTYKTLRWYKKLGIHTFHLMLNNAFLLYNMYSNEKKYDLYDFHIEVVSKLLPKPTKQPVYQHQAHIHLPQSLPKNAKNETMRKRCKQCSRKLKIRKETAFGCPSCTGFPGFCLTPCFREYHDYK